MIKKNIQNLKPYTCARDLYKKGIFLDANENSFGSVISDISKLKFNRYPDPYATEFKAELTKYLKIPQKYIFCGVGSDEVIDLLFRIFVNPKENILINQPTYGLYQVAADINNIKTKTVLLDDNFDLDLAAIDKKITKQTKIIITCSPNNPTSNLLSKQKIFKLCRKYKNKIIIVDEAYIEFSNQPSLATQVKKYKNLIVTRTLSKAWGLAGIRLGYAMADPKIITALNKTKAPYNINSITQAIGVAALKNKSRLLKFRQQILKQRKKLEQELKKIDLEVLPSDSNFLIFKIKNATKIYKTLANKYGIVVRDRSNEPKMKNCLRITVGTPEQNQKFLKALRKIV